MEVIRGIIFKNVEEDTWVWKGGEQEGYTVQSAYEYFN